MLYVSNGERVIFLCQKLDIKTECLILTEYNFTWKLGNTYVSSLTFFQSVALALCTFGPLVSAASPPFSTFPPPGFVCTDFNTPNVSVLNGSLH